MVNFFKGKGKYLVIAFIIAVVILLIAVFNNAYIKNKLNIITNITHNSIQTNEKLKNNKEIEENVIVELNENELKEKELQVQYHLGEEPNIEDKLSDYKAPIILEHNNKIWARSIDEDGKLSDWVLKIVDNIDKLPPVIDMQNIQINTNEEKTMASLTVNVRDDVSNEYITEDLVKYGTSGIIAYGFSEEKDKEPTNKVTVNQENELKITKENITKNKTYYLWVWDAAGNYTVQPIEINILKEIMVARIISVTTQPGYEKYEELVGTEYTTLEGALEVCPELEEGTAVIQIINNIINESNEITKIVTIDLAGYTVGTISTDNTTPIFDVKKDCKLTLIDSDLDGDGKIENTISETSNYNEQAIGVVVQDGGTFTLGEDDGVVSITKPSVIGVGYGVYNKGNFNFYDGIITANVDKELNTIAINGNVTDVPIVYSVSIQDFTEPVEKQTATLAIIANIEAQIGRKSYVKLEEAIEAVGTVFGVDGSQVEIDIVGDFEKTNDIIIDKNKNIKLDINGHVITVNGGYEIKNYGNLEVIDSTANNENLAGEGSLSGLIHNMNVMGNDEENEQNKSIINNVSEQNNANLTIKSGKFYPGKSIDGISQIIRNEGNLYIENSTVENDEFRPEFIFSGYDNFSHIINFGNASINAGEFKHTSSSIGKEAHSIINYNKLNINAGKFDMTLRNKEFGEIIIDKKDNDSFSIQNQDSSKVIVNDVEGLTINNYDNANVEIKKGILKNVNNYDNGFININSAKLNSVNNLSENGVIKLNDVKIENSNSSILITNEGNIDIDGNTELYSYKNTATNTAVKPVIENKGCLNFYAGTIVAEKKNNLNSTGIQNTGTVNFGRKDSEINLEKPSITSSIGISDGGIVNFYDGIITSDKNLTIRGSVSDIPEGAKLLINMEEDKEVAKIVVDNTPIAKIGEKTYMNLKDAINDVPDGLEDTTKIEILSDYVDIHTHVISDNKNITIDFNEYTIRTMQEKEFIINNGILTFVSDATNVGEIFGANSQKLIENNGTLEINNINIKKSNGILVNNDGEIIVNSGEIKLSSIENNSNGKITVNGGKVESTFNNIGGNIIVENGEVYGELSSKGGKIQINDGIINVSKLFKISEGSILEINGGNINCSASISTNYVSLINIDLNSKLIVNGGNINHNGSSYYTYYLIQVEPNGYFEINDGTIESNAFSTINNLGELKINGGSIYGATNIGIKTSSNSNVIIGEKNNESNKENPYIYGKARGLLIEDSTVSFYDGCIEGGIGKSIVGTILELETGFEIIKNIDEQTSREKAILDKLPVAKIESTGEEYYKLQEAIEDCKNNSQETIQILRNVTLLETDENILIEKEKNIKIDLNGYKISNGKDEPIIVKGKLMLTTSKINDIAGFESMNDYTFEIENLAEFEVENVKITSIYNEGIIHIINGKIEELYNNAIALDNQNANVIIDNGEFAYISNDNNGKILINNIKLENKENIGYAIRNNGAGEITINNCNITVATTAVSDADVMANYKYSAIVNIGGGIININGGSITANEKMFGITNFYGTVNITGGNIVSNIVGPAVLNKSLYGESIVNISGGEINSTYDYSSSNQNIINYATIVNEKNAELNITGGTIKTDLNKGNSYVIYNKSILNLGEDNKNINNESIQVITNRYGIVNADNSTFNYYYGTVKGGINKAISGTISKLPENAEINYNRDNSTNVETATIGTEKVAMIGETSYNTLRQAIDSSNSSVNNPVTIKLIKDIGIGGSEYIISEEENIVIDLNGHKINQLTRFSNSGILEFIDSTEEKNGTIEVSYRMVDNTGILKINDIKINTKMPENETIEERTLINNLNNGSIELISGNIEYEYKGTETASIIYTTSSGDIKLSGGNINIKMDQIRVVNCNNENANIILDGTSMNLYKGTYGIYMLKSGNVNVKSGKIVFEDGGSSLIPYAIYNNATEPNGELIIDGGNIEGLYSLGFKNTKINGGNIIGEAWLGNNYETEINGGKVRYIDSRGNILINDGEINHINADSIHSNIIMLGGIIDNIVEEKYFKTTAVEISAGSFTLGKKEYPVSATSPVIKGKDYGVAGKFNFYDGVITGGTEAISGSITDIDVPDLYKIVFSENSTKAVLGPDNTVEEIVSVGGKYFTSLEAAINDAATTSGTIMLHKDIELEKSVTIEKHQNVTINLNGYNIMYDGEDSAIINNGICTIVDEIIGTESEETASQVKNKTGIAIINNGTLTIGVDDDIVQKYTPNIIGIPDAIKNNGTLKLYDGLLNGNPINVGIQTAELTSIEIHKLSAREVFATAQQKNKNNINEPKIYVDIELPIWTNDKVIATIVATGEKLPLTGTYNLVVTKVDKENEKEKVKGAKFEIYENEVKVGVLTDSNDDGVYESGPIIVKDAGVKNITIKETVVPTGYKQVDDIKGTIIFEENEEKNAYIISESTLGLIEDENIIFTIKEPRLDKYDLSVKKFISMIDDKKIENREPVVKVKEDGKFEYIQSNEIEKAANGQKVTYTLRMYNESENRGKGKRIIEYIPDGLVYLPDNEVNKKYGWKPCIQDENGIIKVAENVKDANVVVSDYLSGMEIKGYNKEIVDYLNYIDASIVFEVDEDKITSEDRIIENKIVIQPNENDDNSENDESTEKLYVKYFDLSIKKYIKEVKVKNNIAETVQQIGEAQKGKLVKIDVAKSEVNNTIITVTYGLKVTNIGEIEGYATEIIDYIPKDFELVENGIWELHGEKAITRSLENKLLKPGESAIVEIVFEWKLNENNLGSRINEGKITEYENPYDAIDRTGENNDKEELIVAVRTGEALYYFVPVAILLGVIGSVVSIICVYRNKKKE